jgi:hypothetical protein
MEIIRNYRYTRSKSWYSLPREKFEYLKTIPWYQVNMEMIFDDNSSISQPAQYFVENNLNKFKGWECDIGLNQLTVEVDEVYRGICKEGGVVAYTDSNNWTWPKDKIVCNKESCNCSFDVMSNKIKK